MIQKAMRFVLAINLATFVVLFIKLGSPLGHLGHPALENFIQTWWVFSTPILLILFILRIVNRARRKDSAGLWLDAALLGTWICALGSMIAIGVLGFAGF